jgi:formate hydrogenlyase subunit 3/multisubunit Na+/H+ antiporter MnhD subunit
VTAVGPLLAAGLAAPVGLLLAHAWPGRRDLVARLLPLAPLPALLAAVLAGLSSQDGTGGGAIALPRLLLGLTLALDAPGAALLLGVSALLWSIAGIHAVSWPRGQPHRARFVVWWLLTLTGGLGVFMAADLISFYLLFSLVSLAAYGLVAFDGTARARRAGAIYVGLAVLGEAFLLMAFVFLAQATPGGGLLIQDAVAALPGSPWRDATLALLILGLGIKIGLVPLHEWMPLAYPAAPIPAAAVLGGAAVKAGVIGFLRFLPWGMPLQGWGEALVVAGMVSAFYGVAVGVTQTNPKAVLAYSSISQMGLLAAVLGMGLAAGDAGAALAAAFYAAHHVLVKGGLFLAVGAMGAAAGAGARRRWLVLAPAGVLALGLAGLPLTGGALAKLAVKGPLGTGFVGLLGSLSAAATTLLMLHFLRRLTAVPATGTPTGLPARLSAAWLAAAIASVAVPWAVYPGSWSGALAGMLAPSALWPLLLGAALAMALARWGAHLPRLPEGDIVVPAERAARAIAARAVWFERLDTALRQWPVAGTALLALAVILAAAMLAG